ncbi:hypothetical protein PRNP1_011968 [Phytophthora ramorum]
MGRRCRRLGRWDIRQTLVALALIPSIRTAAQSLVVSEANCSLADEAQNASVTLTWTLFDGAVNYTRISHSSEALLSTASSLPDRLLILGGIEYESAQPVVDSPVLVYNIATNVFLKPQDQILSAVSAAYQPTGSTIESVFVSPASRTDHASFLTQDGAVFLFGGQSREFLNDTWRGCVDASSSNVVWDELVTATDATTVAAAPVPRIGHSFTKVFENSTTIGALVFGGLSGDYIELRGLHLALIAKASSSASPACTNRGPKLSWRMLKAAPLTDSGAVPTARAYHAAMTTSRLFTASRLACLVVHGGKSTQEGVIFNELWRLCPPLAPDSTVPVERLNYTWELLTEIGTTPGARYGASMTFVDEGKLALAGGSYTFPSDFLSDTWELNVNATQWVRLSFSEDYAPPRRGHSLSFFSTTTRLFLFGGRDRYAVVSKRMQAAYYGAPFCGMGLKITFCTATSNKGLYSSTGTSGACVACPKGSMELEQFLCQTINLTGASTSAVSSDSDNKLTVYVDDMNGGSLGATGSSVASSYVRQANGTALAVATLDRLAATQLTLSPQSTATNTNFGVALRDQPLNLLLAIDFSAAWVSAFMDLLPAIVAQLQIIYRSVPDGVRLGLVNGTATNPTAVFYSSLAAFFDAAQALAASSVGNSPLDWDWVSKGLVASSTSWPATDRRQMLIVAGDTLTAGGSVTLPSALIDQLRSQNVFAFTLSSMQVTFPSGSDVMKSVAYGTTAAILAVLRQAFEEKDSALPSSANTLNDPAGLVSSVQVTSFSSGSSSLPVVRVSMKSFPTPAQLEAFTLLTIRVGIPGGSFISIEIREPGQACFPPTQAIAVDSLPLSGWADAWHLSTLSSIQRLWKPSTGSSTLGMALYQDTSLLRTSTSTILSISDSASTHLGLKRTYPGSFFAAGLSLATRGYWRSGSGSGAANCSIQLDMVGTNTSLTASSVVPFASHVTPGEWNYGYSQSSIPWELSSLSIALTCNTSSPGFAVEWAALGLLPDPDFACKCPRGFYHGTLSDEGGDGSCVIHVRALPAGMDVQLPEEPLHILSAR